MFLVDLWRRECCVYTLRRGTNTSLQDVRPLFLLDVKNYPGPCPIFLIKVCTWLSLPSLGASSCSHCLYLDARLKGWPSWLFLQWYLSLLSKGPLISIASFCVLRTSPRATPISILSLFVYPTVILSWESSIFQRLS